MAERLRLHRRAQQRPTKKLTKSADLCLSNEVKVAHLGSRILQQCADSVTRDLKASVAPNTANGYTPPWLKFKAWCAKQGEQPLPASEATVVAYLASSSDGDRTYSPTKKRIYAIAFFHNLHNLPSPCNGTLVTRIKRGIRGRVGYKGSKKNAVCDQDVRAVRRVAEASKEPVQVLVAGVSSIMHEEQFWFDDVRVVALGDIVYGKHYIKILVVDPKSDQDREGQWGVLAVSSNQHSAYQRLIALIRTGIARFANLPGEVKHALRNSFRKDTSRPFLSPGISAIGTAPPAIVDAAKQAGLPLEVLENLPILGKWIWGDLDASGNLRSTMAYKPFLAALKALFVKAGHREEDIGTHSLRRGGATEKISAKIDARLVKFLGRWRSEKTFAGYIDAGVSAQLCAKAIERTRRA